VKNFKYRIKFFCVTHVCCIARGSDYFFQEVAVLVQEEMCFISLIERKHIDNRRTVYRAPIFVAHFPGHPYFFTSPSGKKEDTLHVSFDTPKRSLLGRILGFHSGEGLYVIWVMTLRNLKYPRFRVTYSFHFQGGN
jgi:hypothetical protein